MVEKGDGEMKAFIGLVLGAIVLGLLLVGGAAALFFGTPATVEVGEAEPIGVTGLNAFPRSDVMAIEVQWTVADPESTYTLQRTPHPDTGDWDDIATVPPGSEAYVDDTTVVYLDEHVEHLETWYYRIYFTTPAGGEGYSIHMAVTAVQPN